MSASASRVVVNYKPASSAQVVEAAVAAAEIIIKNEAEVYGWSDWVKTEIQRHQ